MSKRVSIFFLLFVLFLAAWLITQNLSVSTKTIENPVELTSDPINEQDDTWGNLEFTIIKDQEQIREELENRGIDYDEVIKEFEPHTSEEE